jgi:hypothetical protein
LQGINISKKNNIFPVAPHFWRELPQGNRVPFFEAFFDVSYIRQTPGRSKENKTISHDEMSNKLDINGDVIGCYKWDVVNFFH